MQFAVPAFFLSLPFPLYPLVHLGGFLLQFLEEVGTGDFVDLFAGFQFVDLNAQFLDLLFEPGLALLDFDHDLLDQGVEQSHQY